MVSALLTNHCRYSQQITSLQSSCTCCPDSTVARCRFSTASSLLSLGFRWGAFLVPLQSIPLWGVHLHISRCMQHTHTNRNNASPHRARDTEWMQAMDTEQSLTRGKSFCEQPRLLLLLIFFAAVRRWCSCRSIPKGGIRCHWLTMSGPVHVPDSTRRVVGMRCQY